MAPKIRVIPSHRQHGPVVYRVEAHEEGDEFHEPIWRCEHEHESIDDALRCGDEWLSARGGEPATAP